VDDTIKESESAFTKVLLSAVPLVTLNSYAGIKSGRSSRDIQQEFMGSRIRLAGLVRIKYGSKIKSLSVSH
jgi:hypothetical protein